MVPLLFDLIYLFSIFFFVRWLRYEIGIFHYSCSLFRSLQAAGDDSAASSLSSLLSTLPSAAQPKVRKDVDSADGALLACQAFLKQACESYRDAVRSNSHVGLVSLSDIFNLVDDCFNSFFLSFSVLQDSRLYSDLSFFSSSSTWDFSV